MLKDIFTISAPIESVYMALTDAKVMAQWSGGPVDSDAQVGGKYSLWGGDVYGVYTALVEPTSILMDWRMNDWAEPSKVTLSLEDLGGKATRVYLEHDNLPIGQEDGTEEAWDQYYFGPIQKLLED